MPMKFRTSFLFAGSFFGLPFVASAGTVVNFHAAHNFAQGEPDYFDLVYSGQGAFSDLGNNIWNGYGEGFNSGGNGANVTSTGSATPVTLTLSPNLGNN